MCCHPAVCLAAQSCVVLLQSLQFSAAALTAHDWSALPFDTYLLELLVTYLLTYLLI
jgi:hypothetical protein